MDECDRTERPLFENRCRCDVHAQDSAGLVIIKVQNKQLDPADLVERIFNTVIREQKPVTKYAAAGLPVTATRHSFPD